MRGVARKIMNLVRGVPPIEGHPWHFPELMLMDWVRRRGTALTVYIVGAHLGYEVEALLDTGAVDRIVLFEALPATAERLRERIGGHGRRVEVVERAVCDFDGRTMFFETNLPGAGSVLEASAIVQESYGARTVYEVEVETVRLDTFMASHGTAPDILWIDVQGAELKVLQGAAAAIAAAKLVFIEVSVWSQAYKGGCVISELNEVLEAGEFRLVQLGTDPHNGTGNALYAKASAMGLASIGAV